MNFDTDDCAVNRPYSVRLAYCVGRICAWPNKSDRNESQQIGGLKSGTKGLHVHLLEFGFDRQPLPPAMTQHCLKLDLDA